jgi:hypothetical protein
MKPLDRMVPVVKCPECGRQQWLTANQRFAPGSPPLVNPGEVITFDCCGHAQSVAAETIRFRLTRVVGMDS